MQPAAERGHWSAKLNKLKKLWCKLFGHDWWYGEILPVELETGVAWTFCRRCGNKINVPILSGEKTFTIGEPGNIIGIRFKETNEPYRKLSEENEQRA